MLPMKITITIAENASNTFDLSHPVQMVVGVGAKPQRLGLTWEEAYSLRDQLDAVLSPNASGVRGTARVLVRGDVIYWKGRKFANNEDGQAHLANATSEAGYRYIEFIS